MWEIQNTVVFLGLALPFHLFILAIIGLIVAVLLGLYEKKINKNTTENTHYYFLFSFQKWTDILTNGLIAFILVWKLAIVLTDFSSVLRDPMLLLFGHGGMWGQMLGGLVALAVMWFSCRKRSLHFRAFIDLLAYWGLATYTLFSFIVQKSGHPTTVPWGITFQDLDTSYHPISLYAGISGVIIILFIHLFKIVQPLQDSADIETDAGSISQKTGRTAGWIFFTAGIGNLYISTMAFQPFALLGFSFYQWGLVVLIQVGLILLIFLQKR